MMTNREEKLTSSSSVPLLEAKEPVNYVPWEYQIKAMAKTVSDTFNVLVDVAPAPHPFIPMEELNELTAAQRRVEEERMSRWKEWCYAESKVASLIWRGIAANQTATNLVRTRTQNQDDLEPGENLPSRVMIQTLRDHYLPQSQNVIRLKEATLRQLKVGLHQPLAEAMVILTSAITDVEAQGK